MKNTIAILIISTIFPAFVLLVGLTQPATAAVGRPRADNFPLNVRNSAAKPIRLNANIIKNRYFDKQTSKTNFNPEEFVFGKRTPWRKHLIKTADSPEKEFTADNPWLAGLFSAWKKFARLSQLFKK